MKRTMNTPLGGIGLTAVAMQLAMTGVLGTSFSNSHMSALERELAYQDRKYGRNQNRHSRDLSKRPALPPAPNKPPPKRQKRRLKGKK